MDRFIVYGGQKLYGTPCIHAAKNSVLPIMAASIVADGKTRVENCPDIYDVSVMSDIIDALGGKTFRHDNALEIDTSGVCDWRLPSEHTQKIRASLFTVGALLARFGCAEVSRTGGCAIGDRPIDIHIDAFRSLGVDVAEGESVTFRKNRIDGGCVKLRYPSVGATESVMIFATSLNGVTTIENAAREPEIVDLQNYLNKLGGKVVGAGTSVVTVEGGFTLKTYGIDFLPSKDRIETGTFLFAGAACGGELQFFNEDLMNLDATLKILSNNACKIRPKNDKMINVEFLSPYNGFGKVSAMPYPAFPTDLQPQLAAAACFADGLTVVEDRVFPNRFGYLCELKKLGADVSGVGNMCVVVGNGRLHGATISAGDLRGGAALLIAAVGAEGRSEILNAYHIDRGYSSVETNFRSLGAKVERVTL